MISQFAAIIVVCAAASTSDEALRAGLVALQQGDLELARTTLEAITRADPREARAWVALSQTYWRLRQQAAADEAAGKAAAFAPDDPVILHSLSIYYVETRQTLKAAQATAKYASKVPDRKDVRDQASELYFAAAKPLLEGQKFSEAASILEEAKGKLPQNPQLELALGVAYYGQRRFNEAAEAFLRTIEMSPETEQPYAFLSKILDQIPNRLPELTRKFADYEAAHPGDASAYLFHARVLDAQSLEPDVALRLLDRSIAIDAHSESAHFERGTVLDRLQRYPEAAAAFERAVELAPADAAAHYRLARDYERMGKHDAARAEREKHARLVKAQEVMP